MRRPSLLTRIVKAESVSPLYITTDCERRDAPANPAVKHAKGFHPRLVGLTEAPEIGAAASAYRVFHNIK
jgi:hypothetical protein